MSTTLIIAETEVALSATHFSPRLFQRELGDLRALQQLPALRSASFTDTLLDDRGLAQICDVVTIDNLNLQGTRVTDAGLAHLKKRPDLRHLRLKDNPQLTDAALVHLTGLMKLESLGVHETSITLTGLYILAPLAREGQLRDICIDSFQLAPAGEDEWRALSLALPGCAILVKGIGEAVDGQIRR
ncbi:MAG: hypothetical protein AAFV53_37530 [Myxococcota bacterium]